MTSKTDLAYHYGLPHYGPSTGPDVNDRRVQQSVTPFAQVLLWRKDEIEQAHRDMHARLGTPIESEFGS